MAKKTRAEIKELFKNGLKPNQEDFADWIDSTLNFKTDNINVENGKLGIKTIAPGAKLHVFDNGGIEVQKGTKAAVALIGDKDGPNLSFDRKQLAAKNGENTATLNLQQDGGDIIFHANGEDNEKITFKSSGKVGVGVENPEAELHIQGDEPTLKIQADNSSNETTIKVVDGNEDGAHLVYDSSSSQENFQIRLAHNDGEEVETVAQFVNSNWGNRRGWLGLLGAPTIGVSAPLHLNCEKDIANEGETALYENGAILIGTLENNSLNLSIDNDEIDCRLWKTSGGFHETTLHLQRSGGAIRYYGSLINASDQKLKKNIKKSPYGLSDLLKLKPVSFKWKNRTDQSVKLGFIAQEVQKVIPELVSSGRDDILAIASVELIPVLVKSIQDQQQTITDQEQRINDLENRLSKLEKIMAKK